jgi:hypothetical protein
MSYPSGSFPSKKRQTESLTKTQHTKIENVARLSLFMDSIGK